MIAIKSGIPRKLCYLRNPRDIFKEYSNTRKIS